MLPVSRAGADHPRTGEHPDRRGGTKLKGPQVVVSELFIYIFIGCSCFTVSMISFIYSLRWIWDT